MDVKEMASLGGKKRWEGKTPEEKKAHMEMMSKKAALARWKKNS